MMGIKLGLDIQQIMNKFGFARTGIFLLLAVALTSSAPVPDDSVTTREEAEREQYNISCLISRNATLRIAYYRSIASKHGVPGTPVGKFSESSFHFSCSRLRWFLCYDY